MSYEYEESFNSSDEKIIAHLPNCNLPVEYTDILSHRTDCFKVEIFDFDDSVSFSTNAEEQLLELSISEPHSESTDDEECRRQLVDNLDCFIERINEMQQFIQEEEWEDWEIETYSTGEEETPEQLMKLLSCADELHIRDLQQTHHHLQCHIDELSSQCRTVMGILHKKLKQNRQLTRTLGRLKESIANDTLWISEIPKKMYGCKELYEYLFNNRYYKSDANTFIRSEVKSDYENFQSFLTQRELQFDLGEFDEHIKEIHEFCEDILKLPNFRQ